LGILMRQVDGGVEADLPLSWRHGRSHTSTWQFRGRGRTPGGRRPWAGRAADCQRGNAAAAQEGRRRAKKGQTEDEEQRYRGAPSGRTARAWTHPRFCAKNATYRAAEDPVSEKVR